jgi:hypothetical protein
MGSLVEIGLQVSCLACGRLESWSQQELEGELLPRGRQGLFRVSKFSGSCWRDLHTWANTERAGVKILLVK